MSSIRRLWSVPDTELPGLTPMRARDLIVECFFHAQHETFTRAKQRVKSMQFDEAAVRAAIVGAVRLAFKESGGDFDQPTAKSIEGAVSVLMRKAHAWGTPADVIAHHRGQAERLLIVLGAPRSERKRSS